MNQTNTQINNRTAKNYAIPNSPKTQVYTTITRLKPNNYKLMINILSGKSRRSMLIKQIQITKQENISADQAL